MPVWKIDFEHVSGGPETFAAAGFYGHLRRPCGSKRNTVQINNRDRRNSERFHVGANCLQHV